MALEHAAPGEVVNLGGTDRGLKYAKTNAITKTDRFEAIQLVVRAGDRIPEHSVSGPITLHCLEGRFELGLEDASRELVADQWIYLEGGAPHSVKAIEDSSILLTIIFDHSA